MSEKEEVLRQISEIKHHLVDKESFFPYNYNACHVWSLIAVVLTFVMIPSYENSVTFGTLVTIVLIVIGFIVEGILTKKVNESYDLDDCTRRQAFVMKNFIMISLFAIVFSAVLAMMKLYLFIFLLWLFLISLGYFSVGFVLNIKAYERVAMFNIFSSLVLLSYGAYFGLLESRGAFLSVVQGVVILGLAVLPTLVALQQQKVEKCNKACGV